MPDLLKLKDSVTKLTSNILPQVPAKIEDPYYTPTQEKPEILSQHIIRGIQLLEEGAKYTQDSVKDLKLENNALISRLAKIEQNVEKYRKKIIHLTTEV